MGGGIASLPAVSALIFCLFVVYRIRFAYTVCRVRAAVRRLRYLHLEMRTLKPKFRV